MPSVSKQTLYIPALALLLLVVASCGGPKTLKAVFKDETPYQTYVKKLEDAKLDQTALGQDWLSAGTKALRDSITVTLPFKETGYFAADKPRALGYKFKARRGERVVVTLDLKSRQAMQVFMDMFELDGKAKHVASAEEASRSLKYEVEQDMLHILRVQPELLRSGQYTVTIKTEPTLTFPVAGKTSNNIASVWGDPRDGGARKHEGVDVFATRGTPVVAASSGVITRVSTTPIGGKVVWLSDENGQQNLYYAHLDSQAVKQGQLVRVGDVLGFVGNTGNAKGTNPHLHFGVYRNGHGATDPYPYLHNPTVGAPDVKAELANIGNWVRVSAKAANVRQQPSTKSNVYKQLAQHTPLFVTGAYDNWYRVALPNGTEAFIASSLVEPASRPIKHENLTKQAALLEEASQNAPAKDNLKAGSKVAILGRYNGYTFIKSNEGEIGWLLL